MSDLQGAGPAPRPVVTKVGGGLSPRLATLVAAGVLGAVVWVGLSGRSPNRPETSTSTGDPNTASATPATPVASPSQTGVAAAPSATPTRAPVLTPPPDRTHEQTPRALPFARDKYAVVADIDDRLYRTLMAEVEPGRFSGSFRVLFPADTSNRYDIRLTQLWSRGSRRGNYVDIGSWPLYLVPLQEATMVSGPVLQTGMSAQPGLRGVPRAVERGFTMTVSAESRVTYGIVRVEIQFGPRAELRPESLVTR